MVDFDTMLPIVLGVFFVGLLGGIAIGMVIRAGLDTSDDYAEAMSWKEWFSSLKQSLHSWAWKRGWVHARNVKPMEDD